MDLGPQLRLLERIGDLLLRKPAPLYDVTPLPSDENRTGISTFPWSGFLGHVHKVKRNLENLQSIKNSKCPAAELLDGPAGCHIRW
jgi:hypothetical protein